MRRLCFKLSAMTILLVATMSIASASEKKMSNADLTALLEGGKTIKLGGPGEGYSGELTLSADGTGSGSAKTDDGTVIKIEGVWLIKGDEFCRTWKGLDGGKEVCETWILVSENKAHVMNGKNKIGVNRW